MQGGTEITGILGFGPMRGVDFDMGGNKEMKLRTGGCAFLLASFLAMASMMAPYARAQQTLGGITGTVTDSSGALVADTTVTLVGDETKLTRSPRCHPNGG